MRQFLLQSVFRFFKEMLDLSKVGQKENQFGYVGLQL